MKKIKLLSALALTLALTACDGYELPNPPGQTNAEPDGYFENSGLVLEAPGTENAFNLTKLNEENVYAQVATIKELVNFPVGYDLTIDMQLAKDNSFGSYTTLNTVIDGDAVTINPDMLNAAVQEQLTKQPGTYDVAVRFVAYAVRENTKMQLGGRNATYCPATFKIITLDAAVVIEDAYYLVPFNADGTQGDLSKAIKMNNTAGSSVSPYDNPEFAVKFDITEAQATSASGYTWKVIPASSYDAGNTLNAFGATALKDGALSGKLAQDITTPGVLRIFGPVLLTINIENQSYEANYALEVLWVLSGSTLTKPQNSLNLYTDNYIDYNGVSVLNSQYYICGQADYKGAINFKQSDDPAEDSEDGFTRKGTLVSTGGSTLTTPVTGNHLYWMDVNLSLLTYQITCINKLTMIGDGCDWDLEKAVEMTPSKDFKTWTAKDVKVGSMFKFNVNGAWDIAFGDMTNTGEAISNLNNTYVYEIYRATAGNCNATPGTYDVTLDFSKKPYIATLVKK